jgi:WD40 repeat protein
MRDSRRIGGCQVLLNAWRGKVLTVDYERNVVTTDAPLPADGRLTGGIVCFSNPAYTRNTPYRIAAVTQADDKTTISLGDSTLLLGKGRVSGAPPDRRTLVSLIPHEYARAKQQLSPNGFFTGKLIRTAGGKKTTRVLDVISGQPLIVRVEDSRPFQDGDDFFYCDVQPGDEFAIHKAETY